MGIASTTGSTRPPIAPPRPSCFPAPQTPLLFMGQEWAGTAPFLYFTDHAEDLGKIVTEGRRREFRHFLAFVDPAERDKIPDPQAPETFLKSRLDWAEVDREPHAAMLRLYAALLKLRREHAALLADHVDHYRPRSRARAP